MKTTAALLLSSLLLAAAPQAARKPNVIFIMADDLGYGDRGCYGQKRFKTPSIDRMAAEGTRFTNYYAGSTVCAPSCCAFMTGYHTGHCTIRGNRHQPLKAEDVTVAKVLKAAGYATGATGKWGLGLVGTAGHPNRQGFDEWFGYLDQVGSTTTRSSSSRATTGRTTRAAVPPSSSIATARCAGSSATCTTAGSAYR
jgi:arylsulfatase A-like enzyme